MKSPIARRLSWGVVPTVDRSLTGGVTVTLREDGTVRAKCVDLDTGTDLGPAGKFKGTLICSKFWRTGTERYRLTSEGGESYGPMAVWFDDEADALRAAGAFAAADWVDTL